MRLIILLVVAILAVVVALFLAKIYRLKPLQGIGSAGLGLVVGIIVEYLIRLLGIGPDLPIFGVASAFVAQLLFTKRLATNRKSISYPTSAIPQENHTSHADLRSPVDIEPVSTVLKEHAGYSGNRRIFLSYRRTDSAESIGRIYDRLVKDFGGDAVFKDVDSIPLGVDFRSHIATQLENCEYFLAVIGKDWLDVADNQGNRRIDNPRDHVRLETQIALKKGIPVIPVLVRGANVPSEERLPDELKDLSFRNGLAVRTDPDFHRDMDRLVAQIKF